MRSSQKTAGWAKIKLSVWGINILTFILFDFPTPLATKISPMKKLAVFALSALFGLPAFSETYYFDAALLRTDGVDVNFSDSLKYWFVQDGEGYAAASALPDLSDSSNSYIFTNLTPSTGTGTYKLILDQNVNAASIQLGQTGGSQDIYFQLDAGQSCESIVLGEFQNLTWTALFYGAKGEPSNTTLTVNGDASGTGNLFGKTNYGDFNFKKITVTGTLTVQNQGYNYAAYNAYGVEGHSISNPDAIFNVIVSRWGQGYFGYGTPGDSGGTVIAEDSFSWINAIVDNGSYEGLVHRVSLRYGGSETSTGTWTNVFTNDGSREQNAVSSGSITQLNANAKLALVMRSSTLNEDGATFTYLNYSQSFTGEDMSFTGGVTMISGGLYLNYSATGADASHGDLNLARAEGAQAATFGNSNGAVGGTFAFSNLVVSDGGGTIAVRMDFGDEGGLVCDTLSFSGKAEGAGTVVIDLRTVNGGEMIDEYVDFLIANDAKLKVISWNEAADAGIVFTTTDGYLVCDYDGELYRFTALNEADGLYIAYVAVPEPAQLAAILAIAAIAFAAYKRRRK